MENREQYGVGEFCKDAQARRVSDRMPEPTADDNGYGWTVAVIMITMAFVFAGVAGALFAPDPLPFFRTVAAVILGAQAVVLAMVAAWVAILEG